MAVSSKSSPEDSILDHAIEPRAQMPVDKTPPMGEMGTIAINFGSLLTRVYGNYSTEETWNMQDVPIRNLIRMYKQDGQISGLYSLMRLPIVGTEMHIVPRDSRSQSEADSIRQNLLSSPHDGGMTTPMRYIKGDIAMASLTGFRAYEKVFDIRKGYVVQTKRGPRNPETISILQDQNGGFAGFRQHVPYGFHAGEYVTIPPNKAFLYVNNKEDNPLYGKSDFLAAYYHYDKLHKLYYVAHMAFQALVLPPRIGTYPSTATDKKEIDDFFAAISRLGFDTAMTVKEGYKVEAFGANRPGMNFLELIDHHVLQMSKSVLAPHIDLGSGKGRGSFALSKDLGAIWTMSVEAKHKDIDWHFNSYVIPQLIDYNFSSRKYPVMKHDPLSAENKDALMSVYTKLMASPSDHASPEFLLSLEEELAKRLDLKEIDYVAIRAARIKSIEDSRAAATQVKQGAVAALMDTLNMDREGNIQLTDKTWDLLKEISKDRQDVVANALLERRIKENGLPTGKNPL